MRLEVWWTCTGHEVRLQWLATVHMGQFQHSLVAAFTLQSKTNTMASIVSITAEAPSFFEFFVRFTNYRLLHMLRFDTFGHVLMATYVIAAEKLLNAPEKATFFLSDIMFHWFVAARIIIA